MTPLAPLLQALFMAFKLISKEIILLRKVLQDTFHAVYYTNSLYNYRGLGTHTFLLTTTSSIFVLLKKKNPCQFPQTLDYQRRKTLDFTGKFYQTYKKIIPSLLRLFQNFEGRE